MSDDAAKPLIGSSTVPPIRAGTRLARLMEKLHGQRVSYRVWHGAGPRRELLGRGKFAVEIAGGWLRCRIFGEMFKPGPFEFAFHVFWLTRRGMIRAAFDLVENRPPERRNAAESFIDFGILRDESARVEARAFLRSLASRK
jgi:hypothetical protein